MIRFKYYKSDVTVKDFGERDIIYAFHDIDGTHSLIRNWPPVMSIVLDYVCNNGVKEGYDSEENALKLISLAGTKPLPESDKFCVESAGLSALTQMEWAIRKSIDRGIEDVNCDRELNKEKIKKIEEGIEVFSTPDTKEMEDFLLVHTPRLFKFYERVLNGFCRDKNLVLARKDPDKFIVDGSKEFLQNLQKHGVKNYFVTGAVVQKGMGMHEEVETLGFEIGPGKIIEDIIGSTWTDKLPKDVIMQNLMKALGAKGENILVVGDGRAEIQAGVNMGALCISRLGKDEDYKRNLHIKLGTDIIIDSFNNKDFKKLMGC